MEVPAVSTEVSTTSTAVLHNIATRLRIDSVRATTEAGSGHPTSCCSMAELMACLFFAEMCFDPGNADDPDNDRFVLSKGHAAPILYAAWAEAGIIDRADLLTLRQIDSDLEGHPTPRLPWVDVATGSLGQGICAAIGIALNARRIGSQYRTYVLLGDGELAEGSVWEAADSGEFFALDSLCAIADVNRLGQSRPTQHGHDLEALAARWKGFGWHTISIDGHDIDAILDALAEARRTTGRPTMILARTVKGKGLPDIEGKDGWHGKPLTGEAAERALATLEAQVIQTTDPTASIPPPRSRTTLPRPSTEPIAPPPYAAGDKVATREAYGRALAELGRVDPRVVALDADVKNSTFSEKFQDSHPERFYEAFIAEQVMVGAAMGLASRGAVPFPSTFACFLSRAADFVRMAGVSQVNVKLAGSHAGVSIGEDGPSQMGLEDLALMRAVPNCTVFYPCDGVSAERLVAEAAALDGPVYLRTSRPKTPVIYSVDERFPAGGCKVLRESASDVATIVAAGVTVFEALAAHDTLAADGIAVRVIDAYSVQPIDAETLRRSARETGLIVTVEDHYAAGGLGDAAAEALGDAGVRVHRLAVREIPRSGKSEELLDRYGISARHIVDAVRALAAAG